MEWCTYSENTRHAYDVLNIKEYPKYKSYLVKKQELGQRKAAQHKLEMYMKYTIRCVETEEEFKNQSEIANKFGISRQAVNAAIKNYEEKNMGLVNGKYHFEHVDRKHESKECDESQQHDIFKETFSITLHLKK